MPSKTVCFSLVDCCFAGIVQAETPEEGASRYHEEAEKLAHGESIEQKADLLVRFSDQLYSHPEESVADKKECENRTVRPVSAVLPWFIFCNPENSEKNGTLERCFVKL